MNRKARKGGPKNLSSALGFGITAGVLFGINALLDTYGNFILSILYLLVFTFLFILLGLIFHLLKSIFKSLKSFSHTYLFSVALISLFSFLIFDQFLKSIAKGNSDNGVLSFPRILSLILLPLIFTLLTRIRIKTGKKQMTWSWQIVACRFVDIAIEKGIYR